MKNLFYILIIIFALNCATANPHQATDAPSGSPSLIDTLKQKAESEEGKKYIEMAKEKAKDKEAQEKIKGFISGKKEEKK